MYSEADNPPNWYQDDIGADKAFCYSHCLPPNPDPGKEVVDTRSFSN